MQRFLPVTNMCQKEEETTMERWGNYKFDGYGGKTLGRSGKPGAKVTI